MIKLNTTSQCPPPAQITPRIHFVEMEILAYHESKSTKHLTADVAGDRVDVRQGLSGFTVSLNDGERRQMTIGEMTELRDELDVIGDPETKRLRDALNLYVKMAKKII